MSLTPLVLSALLLTILNQATAQDQLSPIVQVQTGLVQGSIKFTPEGRQFYAYQGIPFGKAPLRFKAPLPADPWTGVLNATYDPPECMQISYQIRPPAVGVEDCLQLNVYTPQLPTNTTNPSFAVNVFIHGGAFIAGNIQYENKNPEIFMNVDIVVVLLKYRLGVLGFLSTDDESASGNAGLLDQNLGLKWVQQNIATFGGNPNDVTLTGQSAGGASVIYQYLSPMSAGLFQRAITESGTAISPWALVENPRFYANAMGDLFNCTTNNSTELIDCLQQQKPEEIVGHSFNIMIKHLTLCYVPSVETSPSGQFLTEDPLVMFETGNFNRVPLQLGFNRDEGVLIYEYVYPLFENITDTTFDATIPIILDALSDYSTNLVNASYAIKDQYYANADLGNQTAVNIVSIAWMSDIFMKSGVTKTAALVSSFNVPTYLYAYNYVSSTSSSNFTGEPDVTHSNEMKYLWYHNVTDPKDLEFGSRFFQLWINFMFTGKPTGSLGADDPWLPTPPGQYNHYDINEQFTMRGNYDPVDMDFWWNTIPAIVNG